MEEWKECFKSKRYTYSVSSLGQIRNDTTQQILSPRKHSSGYLAASLGREKQELIHRLVAKAFCDNPNNYTEVDHINKDKTDNKVENLRWATRSQNCQNKNAEYISFVVQINRNGMRFRKTFQDYDQAVEYRNKILEENPIV